MIHKVLTRVMSLVLMTTMTLTGTAPTAVAAQSFGDILGRSKNEGSLRRLTSEQRRDARSAQTLFQRMAETRGATAVLPATTSTATYNPRDEKSAVAMRDRPEAALDAYDRETSSRAQPSVAVLTELREATWPFVRYLNAIAQRRGVKGSQSSIVAPGTVRTFDVPAYCMDMGLPSPKHGEAFRLTPAADLLPSELVPIQRALMVRNTGHDYAYQGIIWDMRGAYRWKNPYNPSAANLATMTAAYPNASEAIAAYNRRVGRAATVRGAIDKFMPGMRQSVSSLMDSATAASPLRTVDQIRQSLEQMATMPVAGTTDPETSYTTIAPGVVAKATSPNGGYSSVRIEIANSTAMPYRPTFSEWAATSERQVQHMEIQAPAALTEDDTGFAISPQEMLTLGLDFSLLGNVKAAMQALIGRDLITGEPVNRWIEAIAIIPVVGNLSRVERLAARELIRAKPYALLVRELKGTGLQAHHLSQDAAYGTRIARGEGLATGLEGNAFRDIGSPHYDVHEELEKFWSPYRPGGALEDIRPSNQQYLDAVEQSLQKAGLHPADAKALAQQAGSQQKAKGLMPDDQVPRVPGRINQRKRT